MSTERNPVIRIFDWIGFKAASLFGGKSKEEDLIIGITAVVFAIIGAAILLAVLLSFLTGISWLWYFGAEFFVYLAIVLWSDIRRLFGV